VNLRYAAACGFIAIPLALLGLAYAPGLVPLFCAEALLGAGNIVIASISLTVLAHLDNPARAWSIKISTDVIFAGAFLGLVPVFGLSDHVRLSPCRLLRRHCAVGREVAAPRDAAASAQWLARIAALGTVVGVARARHDGRLLYGGIAVWTFLERLAVHAGSAARLQSETIAISLCRHHRFNRRHWLPADAESGHKRRVVSCSSRRSPRSASARTSSSSTSRCSSSTAPGISFT
jgi:hypothetical protein